MDSHPLPSSPEHAGTALLRYELEIPIDHVVLSMPQDDYTIAFETLETDAQSCAFDRALRADLARVTHSYTQHDPAPHWQPKYSALLAKLEEAIASWPQFASADHDNPVAVSGADLVQWFDRWYRETRDLTTRARTTAAGGAQ